MSDGTLRKHDRLRGQFKSLKGFFQPRKKTKEENTGNSQTNHTTANSFSAPVPAPSDPTPTPSTIVATTTEFSLEAQSRGAIRIASFQSDSASQSGQTPVTATVKHAAHTEVGNKEEQQHNSTATGTVKAQSLWRQALRSQDLDEERETLNSMHFQANALDTVSEARSFAHKILNDKKEKPWKIEIKGETIVLSDIAMKLLGWMDRFKEIGDIIVQFDPVHAALPWAGFRFILKVCMDQQKTMDAILVGLENIAGLIQRCTLYELLYLSEDSSGSKILEKSMLQLYIAILKFLAKAIGKLKQNRLKAVFTTEDISNYLGKVENLEKTVGYDADVAKAESTRTELAHLRTQLENINNTTLHFQPQLQNIQDWLEDSERSSILEWISTIPYLRHHELINAGRLEGTGQWLLERQDYRTWISSSVSKLLLLRGIPGAGKTYIASKVIDSLPSNTTGMKLAYFYCNRAEENRREPDSILSTIIQQLAQSPLDENKLPKPIVDIYRERKKKGQITYRLSLLESRELLVQLTDIYPRTMICIDALDEIAEDKRIHLLKALNYVIAQSKSLVKIFATTRMDPEIVAHFEMFPRIVLQPEHNVSDINQFIKTRVKSTIDDRQLLSGNVSDELQIEICEVLCTRSQGMFQLAALQITFLCQFRTEGNVKDNLKTLPDTLAAAYDVIYDRIIAQKGDAPQLALNAFRWIQCSYEPLRAETLLDTITVQVGRSGEFCRKAPIKANDLLTTCQNLLILDERLNVFRFAHLSVEEYLETKPKLSKAYSHTEIAKGCLSLLCTPSSWDDYDNIITREGQYRDRHLLLYSVVFWPWHFSHCEDVKKKKKKNGCQTLTDLWNSFASESNYQRWHNYHGKWVVTTNTRDTFWERVNVCQQEADNLLSSVCVFGLSRIFTSVFESTRHDLKADLGRILVMISQFGDLDITRLLIDKGADVSVTDEGGQTPLHLASEYGREGVAQLLIDKGADVTVTDEGGQTPLHLASEYGREGVAQLLIDKGADVSAADKYRQTPLHIAVLYKCESVAQLLIDNGADVSATDKDGQTPLHLALIRGREGVAQLLIDKGTDVSVTDEDGQTPLHLASMYGYEGVAQLLIDKAADVSVTDKAGWTPLHLALIRGRERVAQLLIDKGTDVSATDKAGRTPLHLALIRGYEGVAKLLIDKAADVSVTDKAGRTPLHLASMYGYEGVAQLLIEKGVDVSATDKDGRTALQLASNSDQSKSEAEAEKSVGQA